MIQALRGHIAAEIVQRIRFPNNSIAASAVPLMILPKQRGGRGVFAGLTIHNIERLYALLTYS
jgi:hypothetical protein